MGAERGRPDRLSPSPAQQPFDGMILEALGIFHVLAQHVERLVTRLRAAEVKKPLRRPWPAYASAALKPAWEARGLTERDALGGECTGPRDPRGAAGAAEVWW